MAEAKIYEVEEVEEEHPHFRSAWNGEMWCPFHIAAEIINCQLDISRGVAERTLRELCAKGDVRSIRSEEYDPDEDLGPGEPEFIRPGEWLGKELDLEAKYPQVVAVSQNGFAGTLNHPQEPCCCYGCPCLCDEHIRAIALQWPQGSHSL